MWIVAIAWVYVVGLMALTEPNVVSGIMTFFGFCVLPLSLVFYITGSKRRRARKAAAAPVADARPAGDGTAYLAPFATDDTPFTGTVPSHTHHSHHTHGCSDSGSGHHSSSFDAGGSSDCGDGGGGGGGSAD